MPEWIKVKISLEFETACREAVNRKFRWFAFHFYNFCSLIFFAFKTVYTFFSLSLKTYQLFSRLYDGWGWGKTEFIRLNLKLSEIIILTSSCYTFTKNLIYNFSIELELLTTGEKNRLFRNFMSNWELKSFCCFDLR